MCPVIVFDQTLIFIRFFPIKNAILLIDQRECFELDQVKIFVNQCNN